LLLSIARQARASEALPVPERSGSEIPAPQPL